MLKVCGRIILKVVSFSLWGDDLRYINGAIDNAALCQKYYPDWHHIFYVHQDLKLDYVDNLRRFGCYVEIVQEPADWRGMFWRFRAVHLKNSTCIIFRDADSRISEREVSAVNEWIASGKAFHIMRDHPAHNAPIQGGMWGVQGPECIGEVSRVLTQYRPLESRWGIDQEFLSEKIYPFAKDNSLVHDEFFEVRPFPTERVGLEFVGEVYDSTGAPRLSDRSAIAAWRLLTQFPEFRRRLMHK